MPSELLTFGIAFSAGFLACMLGWQINLVVIQRGIDRGRTAGMSVGMGAIAADLVFLGIGFTGLYPFAHHPELWTHLKWVAVGILLFVAYRGFKRKKKKEAAPVKRKNPAKNFILGFLLVVSNPLVLFLWLGTLSFLIAHFPGAKILHHQWIFLVGFFIGAALWFLFVCLWILSHARKWNEERLHQISKVMAVLLVIAAGVLLFAKI